MTKLDSILKSRDITLSTNVCPVSSVQFSCSMVFPVVMYGCESWTIKKAEHWRIDAWTVVLEKTLESPLDCKEIKPVNPKGNQPWIFIGRTDAEAEAPVLWPPMWRADPLEKILMLGKTEGKRRRRWQRMRWFDGITDSMHMNVSKLREITEDREGWSAAVHGVAVRHDWATEQGV